MEHNEHCKGLYELNKPRGYDHYTDKGSDCDCPCHLTNTGSDKGNPVVY